MNAQATAPASRPSAHNAPTTIVEAGQLWPIPTLSVTLQQSADFNARLAAIILAEEVKIRASNTPTAVAGIADGLTAYWLNFNVFHWDYPEIRTLRDLVLDGLQHWMRAAGLPDDPSSAIAGISSWANVLRYGECLSIHHHDPAFVSAHYTVQSGFEDGGPTGSPDSGSTVYFRPGFADRSHGGDAAMSASPWDDDWRVERPATPGRLFFFPSFVRHEVRPYLGRTARISIAMDVFLKRQALPIFFGGPRWFVPGATDVRKERA